MKIAGIVLSFGRVELCDLLAMWTAQTRNCPLLVWLDGAPPVPINVMDSVLFHEAPRMGKPGSVGPVRAAAVALARERFELSADDGIVMLDDDDYYHPRHVELSTLALEQGAEWTGALRIGLQHQRGADPIIVESSGGPGTHAAWAMRLRAYDAGGGYQAERVEDMALASRIGWKVCQPHAFLTHVRRHHTANLCRSNYDRDLIRARTEYATVLHPTWSPELQRIEEWADARLLP